MAGRKIAPNGRNSAIEPLNRERARDLVSFTMAVNQLSKGVDKSNPEDMRERFYAYIRLASECGMSIGNVGAYTAIGVSKPTVLSWRRGERTREHQELIEEIDRVCALHREQAAATGECNVAWAIFAAKNYDGMQDVTDLRVDPVNKFDDKSAAEIADKYKELPE